MEQLFLIMRADTFKMDNGDVTITCYKDRGTVEHKYWCVPKSIVCKYLNSKKQPSISDFECWLRSERDKNKKSHDVPCIGETWWET
jgi:hypothetical protein